MEIAMSTVEANKRIACTWLELVSRGDVETLCALTAPGWTMHGGPSGGDPDMLEEGRRHHGIAFEAVISVPEAGGAFKQHRATYTKAAELFGVRREEVLFVANHEFDVVGAKAARMRAPSSTGGVAPSRGGRISRT
jgi:hypothetical protein